MVVFGFSLSFFLVFVLLCMRDIFRYKKGVRRGGGNAHSRSASLAKQRFCVSTNVRAVLRAGQDFGQDRSLNSRGGMLGRVRMRWIEIMVVDDEPGRESY